MPQTTFGNPTQKQQRENIKCLIILCEVCDNTSEIKCNVTTAIAFFLSEADAMQDVGQRETHRGPGRRRERKTNEGKLTCWIEYADGAECSPANCHAVEPRAELPESIILITPLNVPIACRNMHTVNDTGEPWRMWRSINVAYMIMLIS